MISHRYRCVFIHIPKTAGTSIEYKLGHFDTFARGVQDHRTIRNIQPLTIPDIFEIVRSRDIDALRRCLRDWKKGDLLSRRDYKRYFKFSIVRNPWARVFSWYKNVMRDNLHREALGISDDCSLNEFVHAHADQWALKPQLHWIKDRSGKIALDYIGRFENIQEDFSFVCERLRIKDGTLPKMLASNDQRYTAYYDKESRALIAKRYATEIEIFGFYYGEYPCT